jgi:hypothetical protein
MLNPEVSPVCPPTHDGALMHSTATETPISLRRMRRTFYLVMSSVAMKDPE